MSAAGARRSGLPPRSGPARLGLGTWPLGGAGWGPAPERAVRLAALHRALELGIRHVDTAPSYGEAESFLGEALGAMRERVVLATKVGPRDDPRSSIEHSLRRLRTDHVDLLFLHECVEGWERQLEALAALREEGLATEIGLSNATPEQIERASLIAPVVAYQGPYNLVDRDVEERHLSLLAEKSVGFWAYRALASGLLAGSQPAADGDGTRPHSGDHRGRIYWFRGRELARRRRVLAGLEELGRRRGTTAAEVALGWVLARPGVSVALAGARTPEQVDGIAAAEPLSPAETEEVDRVVAEAFRPPRATPAALGADWGERERFIIERLDGTRTYERIAAEWSAAEEKPMVAAQVKVFADDLAERGLVSDG